MQQKTAIVTGVSRLKGIGRAICTQLAKNGINIFFTYWQKYDQEMPWASEQNEPDIIQSEIESLGVKCSKIELDLSKAESVDILFQEVKKEFGFASALVNNACYSTSSSIFDISPEVLDQHYYVNVRAVTLLCSRFVQQFAEKKGGRIINISSGQSLSVMNNELAYAITKSSIETLTKTISSELAVKGITVNAVNPGLTDSGWIDENTRELFKDRNPSGRFGQPEDAARLVSFLISEEAQWITGQVIHSEGGFIREKYGDYPQSTE